LRKHAALSGALAAVTAAVVGVIANLALWFGLHALFGQVRPHAFLGLDIPQPGSVRWIPVLLTGLALVMTFALKWGLARNLAVCAGLGIAFTLWT
jgi:chromate transporter